MIPVCSEVTLLAADQKSLTFKVDATGSDYTYVNHRRGRGAARRRTWLATSAATCPRAELDALTPLEKEGVRLGVAKKGMRKQAVILAIGYPPLQRHAHARAARPGSTGAPA